MARSSNPRPKAGAMGVRAASDELGGCGVVAAPARGDKDPLELFAGEAVSAVLMIKLCLPPKLSSQRAIEGIPGAEPDVVEIVDHNAI